MTARPRRQAGGVAVALVALTALIVKQMGLGGEVHPLGVLARGFGQREDDDQ